MAETHVPVLVRMSVEQKDSLVKSAKMHSRTLTGEINERLRISLGGHGPTLQGSLARKAGIAPAPSNPPPSYTTQPTATIGHTNDNGPANALTDIARAMLAVFHTLPPEKQLALLSLFR